MSPRIWLIPAVLFSLSLSSNAQSPWDKDPVNAELIGDPTRSDHGQLTADLDPDVIIVEDGEPVVHVSPALHTARLFFPQGTTTPDLAILRRDQGEHEAGERDEVLTIGNSGLLAWSWDDANAEFDSRSLGTSAWVGVDRLAFAESDDPNERVIIGGVAAPKSIVLLHAPDTVNELEDSFTPARPALDIVPFRRDGMDIEIAMTTELGVLTYRLDGTLTGSFLGASGGKLAAATTDGVVDDLIWVRPASGGGQEMVVIENSSGTLTAASPISLGGLGVVSIATGDFDHDDDDDVLLNHQTDYETHIYTNDNGDFTSSAVRYLHLGPESVGASTNNAEPIVADFDRDGDLDVAMGATYDLALYVRYNGEYGAAQYSPPLNITNSQHLYCDDTQTSTLILNFDSANHVPIDSTHFEVAIWQHDWTPHVTDTESVGRYLVELGSGPLEIEHSFSTPSYVFEPVFFVCSRYLELGTGGELVSSFPARVRAICATDGRANAAKARWNPNAVIVEVTVDDDPTCTAAAPHQPDDDTNDVNIKPIPDEDDNGDPNNGHGGGG